MFWMSSGMNIFKINEEVPECGAPIQLLVPIKGWLVQYLTYLIHTTNSSIY
jgi:hypothetical protein